MGRPLEWRSASGASARPSYSTPQRTGTKICNYFNTPQGCSRGASCKFSHDIPADIENQPPPLPNHQPRRREESTAEEAAARRAAKGDYNAWKKYIRRDPPPFKTQNDLRTIEMVWDGALNILNGEDRDSKQDLARDLVDKDLKGRQHMQTLLGLVINATGTSTFFKLVRPFLLVISHSGLLDCLAVDTAVGEMYNFISGSNGTRAIPFLRILLNNLNAIHSTTIDPAEASSLAETFTGATISLREVLRREPRAVFHEDLPKLVDDFEEFCKVFAADRPTVTFRNNSILGEVRGMIARALGLVHHEEPKINGVSTTAVTSRYPRTLELPGSRHDNDKLDITEIQILPTENEIKCDQQEFLPSSDRDEPYFLTDPVQRHLDTHFRLYRYDVFGTLIEDIGGFMLAAQKDPTLLNAPRYIGDIRSSFIFHNATISDIQFQYQHHQRRNYLEISVTFPQPSALRHMNALDRSRWWDDAKRFTHGALLCFISFDGTKTSLLFFIVSKKETSQNENKIGLASNPALATIALKLATSSKADLELLTKLRCGKTQGLLIELPGVLPTTFMPVLENLQNMQRQGRLPFRKWILPDPADDAMPLEIPPPLYAQSDGFQFSLKPLLKDSSEEFLISATMSHNDPDIIDEIERRTELDHGQCEALVAALTREFAFIQGPPGTGKSYLGVALMKVPLEGAEKANLGPILVVCYTNHALDQFLEHLDQIGVQKIIRIGGQSKSETLKSKNLKVVAQEEPRSKSEGYNLAQKKEQTRRCCGSDPEAFGHFECIY